MIENIKKLAARLSAFDWSVISLYGVAVCGAVSIGALNSILKPWGVPDTVILALSAKIGSLSALFALAGMIATRVKNPSPRPGTYNVFSTQAQPNAASLTTAKAISDKPTDPPLPPPGTKV